MLRKLLELQRSRVQTKPLQKDESFKKSYKEISFKNSSIFNIRLNNKINNFTQDRGIFSQRIINILEKQQKNFPVTDRSSLAKRMIFLKAKNKKSIKLSQTFNRTKTDTSHNFTGDKYLLQVQNDLNNKNYFRSTTQRKISSAPKKVKPNKGILYPNCPTVYKIRLSFVQPLMNSTEKPIFVNKRYKKCKLDQNVKKNSNYLPHYQKKSHTQSHQQLLSDSVQISPWKYGDSKLYINE